LVVPYSITVIDPEAGSVPDQEPSPVHDDALVLDHVNVALWPGITVLGLKETLTVGLG
jgi:hypothetical protein